LFWINFILHISRWWDDNTNEVKDGFFDYSSVGHETADIQVDHIVKSLTTVGLTLGNMICLSRDGPNVMKAVFRKLEQLAIEAGNPKVIDAPCYLHPVHTSFVKVMTSLAGDPLMPNTDRANQMYMLLVDLHGFLKHTTARREDLDGVREELSEKLGAEFNFLPAAC
jgi:hypothetical protein